MNKEKINKLKEIYYIKKEINKIDNKNPLKKQLIEIEKEIQQYIEEIPNSEIRQLFRYRYLENMSWIQIAHQMNSEYKVKKYNNDNVRKKHDRYLKKTGNKP